LKQDEVLGISFSIFTEKFIMGKICKLELLEDVKVKYSKEII